MESGVHFDSTLHTLPAPNGSGCWVGSTPVGICGELKKILMTIFYDLTRLIRPGMSVFPGDPMVESVPAAEHDIDGYGVTRWTFGSHVGTHIDAPRHLFADGKSLDAFGLDHFFLSAAVIDLTPTATSQENLPAVILPIMLSPFEKIFERAGAVILKTGWSGHWGKEDFYTGFPSLTPEAAEWLTDFPLGVLGVETPSLSASDRAVPADARPIRPDRFDDDAICHRILLGSDPPILPLEGLLISDAVPTISAATARSP